MIYTSPGLPDYQSLADWQHDSKLLPEKFYMQLMGYNKEMSFQPNFTIAVYRPDKIGKYHGFTLIEPSTN